MRHVTADTVEGTWEEIAGLAERLSGKRVRLTILSDDNGVPANGAAEASTPEQTLADVLAGLTGVIRSREHHGGTVLPLSEDETSFGEYLEQKRQEGRL
jgi:hypothetical protein